MWEQFRLFRARDPGARKLFFARGRFFRSSECHCTLAVTRKRWTGCLHACKASASAIPAHPSSWGKEPGEWCAAEHHGLLGDPFAGKNLSPCGIWLGQQNTEALNQSGEVHRDYADFPERVAPQTGGKTMNSSSAYCA